MFPNNFHQYALKILTTKLYFKNCGRDMFLVLKLFSGNIFKQVKCFFFKAAVVLVFFIQRNAVITFPQQRKLYGKLKVRIMLLFNLPYNFRIYRNVTFSNRKNSHYPLRRFYPTERHGNLRHRQKYFQKLNAEWLMRLKINKSLKIIVFEELVTQVHSQLNIINVCDLEFQLFNN